MSRDLRPILHDILEAIAGIRGAVGEIDFQTFESDWLIRHGVQRGIEIISEASRRLPDDLLADYPSIPWRPIRDIGNVLRHEYHAVSDRVIWNVVKEHLPPLEDCVREMLSGMSSDPH